jgi:hypothetical protein
VSGNLQKDPALFHLEGGVYKRSGTGWSETVSIDGSSKSTDGTPPIKMAILGHVMTAAQEQGVYNLTLSRQEAFVQDRVGALLSMFQEGWRPAACPRSHVG